MYVDFSAGNKDYKLRLNTRNIISLEKQIGCNPLMIFGIREGEERIPTITEMVYILHCSLQAYHHGISLDDTYDIFDAYRADGHSSNDFIQVIMEIYKVSGLIQTNEKN